MNTPSESPQPVPRYAIAYLWTMIGLGVLVWSYSLYSLVTTPPPQMNWRFGLLACATILVGRFLIIRIPQGNGELTVADTFIFLTILLYGGEAAILLAGVEGVYSRTRLNSKPVTLLFSGAVFVLSTLTTVWLLQSLFGNAEGLHLHEIDAVFILALLVMSATQYLINTGLVAIGVSLKNRLSVWQTWTQYYLWASVTYFVGAVAAGVAAKLIDAYGFYAVIAAAPFIAFLFLTYRMYLQTLESSMARASQARINAEQAERHAAELSRYIAEQERIRQQFLQIEKLSALGELASGVAHNFNNNLAAILARAQLTMRKTTDPEVLRNLELMVEAAQDGARTVRQIQDYARQRRSRDFTIVDVNHLLREVQEITSPRWKDSSEAQNIHIQFIVETCSGAKISGDPSELRDMLVNMIFNAVDALPHGGRITIGCQMDGEFTTIYITDTGVGINEETRARIFDPFFTTKGTNGMGMGLAVTYGVIRRHEGTIDVKSVPGQGTTFTIKLPSVIGGVNQGDRR